MREILFRGKRIDHGEWVEGAFRNDRDGAFYICPADSDISYGDGGNRRRIRRWYNVDPSTVGQYTGLKDKNGRKIWEGDIIKIDNGKRSSISVVKFGEYYPKMFYDMMDMCLLPTNHMNANGFFAESTKHEDMILFKSPFFEIIGNIHDNKLEDFDNGR